VVDNHKVALEAAEIVIHGLDRVVSTDASGAFRLEGIAPGKYWVTARRIGHHPFRAALTFQAGQDRELDFTLSASPRMLDELRVEAVERAWARRYQDWVWRSQAGRGRFLTQDDIAAARGTYLGEVVRRYFPASTTTGLSVPQYLQVATGRQSDRDCAPMVSLDGNRPRGEWAVNDFRADAVAAVEIYRLRGEIPIEFQDWAKGCGLVVVWLK
jgi:hypothetical protein